LDCVVTTLAEFLVTKRWPPVHPDRLQLYSLPTPNGVKVSIMLEETGLSYEVHKIDFARGHQRSPEYLSLNPNGKIPAILDPYGPDGQPLALYESGAILLYLAQKSGQFMPRDPAAQWHVRQWLMWQVSNVGPMFGQVGYFHKFEGLQVDDKRPLEHYAAEVARLLGILDERLEGREWVMGDEFTIADISLIGMVRNLIEYYDAGDLVDYDARSNVQAWLARALARPAVARGLGIPV
jgi:GSH-dependent disulfide-bond oxidoreductase